MEWHTENNRVWIADENGKMIAEVTFPETGAGIVTIDHTFVDGSLRGQGIAEKLTRAAGAELRRTGRKALLTCAYAKAWFPKHPEYADILAETTRRFVVEDIAEEDFGCEGRPDGTEKMDIVLLKSEDGEEKKLRVRDAELYEKGIEVGASVELDSSGELKSI